MSAATSPEALMDGYAAWAALGVSSEDLDGILGPIGEEEQAAWRALGLHGAEVKYRQAGLTPDTYAQFAALGITDRDSLILLGQHRITPAIARAYQTTRPRRGKPAAVTGEDIHVLAVHRVPPQTVLAYRNAGIRQVTKIADLHTWGCTPHVAAGWMTARVGPEHAPRTEHRFHSTYGLLATGPGHVAVPPDLINEVMRHGGYPERMMLPLVVRAWAPTRLPAERIMLLINAGVTPQEATSPDIQGADEHTLRSVAALRKVSA